MFCPLCRTEYREGFTTCSDCHLALVAELPKWNAPEAYAVLWNGENTVFGDRLLEQVEKAGIGAFSVPLEVLHRNSINLFGLRKGPQFGFAVCVVSADYPAAVRVLKSIFEQSAAEPDVAPEWIAFNKGATEVPPDLPLHWDRATATVEAWTGENESQAKFIQNSLHGVGVPTWLCKDEKGLFRLMIRPEDEARGREIVRQIADSAAPEVSQFRPLDSMWLEDPVQSYLYLWLIAGVDLLLALLGVFGSTPNYARFLDVIWALASFAMNIGLLWAIYQAVRYEIYPLRFILIAFLPFSFVWYYYERYANRRGSHRLPIAVRMRVSPPQAFRNIGDKQMPLP
jgi:hypothetical protein